MSALLETYRGTVYPWHCDHMGHMNVMWYAGKFDEASWNLLAELALTRDRMQAGQTGMVAAEQRTSYVRELVAGDVVTVHTGVVKVGGRSLQFVHRMLHAASGALCAVTLMNGVHIDLRTRRTCALPDDVLRLARARVVTLPLPWAPIDPSTGVAPASLATPT